MVFIAFLVPLGLYLLLLGWINRQSRPVVVSGTWDFVGVLFGASGFLLVGGPAILSGVNERWRELWLLGETGGVSDGLEGARNFYILLAGLYFVLVVGVSGMVLARRRGLTSIYNIEPGVAEDEIEAACEQLGLEPIRSGGVFVFGLVLDPPSRLPVGVQAPHAPSFAGSQDATPAEEPGEELVGQNAVLEVESFAAMRHATLRWDAVDTPVRAVVEAELTRRLSRVSAAYHDTGAWLTMAGAAMLGLSVLILVALSLRMIYLR